MQLVVPKHHGPKLTDIPDESLTEILVCAPSYLLTGNNGDEEDWPRSLGKNSHADGLSGICAAGSQETRPGDECGELQRVAE